MDLRSLLQGKSLFHFKTLARLRFSRGKTDKTDNESSGQPKANSDQTVGVDRCNSQTDSSHRVSSDEPNKSVLSNTKGKLKDESRSQAVKQKDKQRDNDCKQSHETPKHKDVDGANTGTVGSLDNLFPNNTHWIVFAFTLVFRVWYVSRKENWWILHPDEVYQTLEVAHSEVYGYGFRTYEYLPAQLPGYHMTAARAQEVGQGMYSLRPFMLPHLIGFFMAIVDRLGISASPFLVGKVFHAIISSCLPLAVYGFTKAVYRSSAVASLAAILVATSQTMNVFGTHSLVNSFLSPFVFLSLTSLSKNVLKEPEQIQGQENSEKAGDNQTLRDQNSNLPVFSDRNKSHHYKKFKANQKHTNERKIKCTRNELLTKYCKPSFRIQFDIPEYFSGLCLSICVYTRCDTVFLPVLVTIACSKFSFRKLLGSVLQLHVFIIGFVTGIFIGGFYDRLCYGVWFISPCQWVKFNVFHKVSHVLFGSEPVTFYIENILSVDFTSLFLSLALILDLIICKHRFVEESQRNLFAMYVMLLLLLPYSLSSHKELRFFHNGLIFLYIHVSSATVRLLQTIVRYANQKHDQYYLCFYLLIGCLASSQLFSFTQIQDKAISKWTYYKRDTALHVNVCFDYVSKQNDVTGVVLDQAVYMTGGYSILHKDVPIYAFHRHEFFEFDRKYRLKSSNIFNQNLSLSFFGQMSDFVSIYNTPYLLKQLILKPEYNYLVLKTDRQFVKIGYAEVFRFGSSKVMKRKTTDESEAELFKMAATINLGNNATVLEYEGYWLIRYGLYKLAEEKLLFANKLKQSRIGPYQLLISMFHQFKQENLVRNVLDACTEVHKKSECLGEYNPVILHDFYYSDLTS